MNEVGLLQLKVNIAQLIKIPVSELNNKRVFSFLLLSNCFLLLHYTSSSDVFSLPR